MYQAKLKEANNTIETHKEELAKANTKLAGANDSVEKSVLLQLLDKIQAILPHDIIGNLQENMVLWLFLSVVLSMVLLMVPMATGLTTD